MSKRYEFLIGRRYLRSNRGNRFVSFISTISMLGIAIGVAVLIVVLSVMNGFEREVRDRILSLTSHAAISAFGSRSVHRIREPTAPRVCTRPMLSDIGRGSRSLERFGERLHNFSPAHRRVGARSDKAEGER